jgi:hypothetical protein
MAAPDVRSTRTIYEGRIFTVTVDRVRLPHGPEIDLEVVRHPGSVVMLCVPAPGQIILVRQYRYLQEYQSQILRKRGIRSGGDENFGGCAVNRVWQ